MNLDSTITTTSSDTAIGRQIVRLNRNEQIRLALELPRIEMQIGDARELLKAIPDEQFRCCVTSPPYWGLRDYGVEGQIGAEMDVDDYVKDLVALFREVRRTLRGDGTFWLNIGDSYTSGGRKWREDDAKTKGRGMSYRAPTPRGLKPKELVGVPWRVAFGLQADGWYLRADNIWYKPNCQPESVKDRPTRSHEYLFLLTKSERYFYDHEAVKEPALSGGVRSKRTVWQVNTEPYAGAHFAVFPPGLVEPCIRAGTQPGDRVLDPFFGSGTVGIACQKLGRACLGIELNPLYAGLAQERLNL